MSVSIEKLKKQIDRLKSAEHKLSVHEDALPRCARNGGSHSLFRAKRRNLLRSSR